MEPYKDRDSYYETNINIAEIIQVLWSDKLIFLSITLIISFSSVFYAVNVPNKYQSTAIMQLAGDDQSSAMSGLSSQYGGIASLAGISLPSASSDKSYYIVNTLRSREFVKHLLTFDGIKKNLMAAKSFDPDTGLIHYDEGIYINDAWVRNVGKNKNVVPSYLEVHEKSYLRKFNVQKDIDSGFIKLSFEHLSPVFAKEFLDLIIQEINLISKKNDLNESETAFKYLEKQLLLNPQQDIKNSINQLMASQLNSMMLANVREDYILTTIDPPHIPEYRSSPDRVLICIFGSILGALIAFMTSITRFYFIGNEKNLS